MEKGHHGMRRGIAFALVDSHTALGAVWPHVSDYLEAATLESMQHDWTPRELYDRIELGEFLLAIVLRGDEIIGAMCFEHGTDPRGRKFVAMVCCGGVDMESWLGGLVALCKKLTEMAGAERIIVVGRRGWAGVLHRYGLNVHAIIGSARVDDITTPVEFADLTPVKLADNIGG